MCVCVRARARVCVYVCVSESVGESTSVLVSVIVDLAAKCYCNNNLAVFVIDIIWLH